MDLKIILAHFSGYAFATLFGMIFIGRVVDRIWKSIGWKGDVSHTLDKNIRPGAWLPPITGFIERILFIGSLQIEKAELIGVWLAVKVASQWKRWSEEEHRSRFQIFLIGNGLSILFSGVGFKIISWLNTGNWKMALLSLLACIALCEAFRMWGASHDENA